MSILDKLLQAWNIKDYGDLNEEEQEFYDRMAKNLSMADPSMEDFRKWLAMEKILIDREMFKYENDPKKDLFFKCLGRLVQRLDSFVNQSKVIRDDAMGAIRESIKKANLN